MIPYTAHTKTEKVVPLQPEIVDRDEIREWIWRELCSLGLIVNVNKPNVEDITFEDRLRYDYRRGLNIDMP